MKTCIKKDLMESQLSRPPRSPLGFNTLNIHWPTRNPLHCSFIFQEWSVRVASRWPLYQNSNPMWFVFFFHPPNYDIFWHISSNNSKNLGRQGHVIFFKCRIWDWLGLERQQALLICQPQPKSIDDRVFGKGPLYKTKHGAPEYMLWSLKECVWHMQTSPQE